ncbi:MAG: type VI secretion system lipoprotein TssJ, partial [Cytophaga sp.]|nr:type VI secretion system lipoprotein TssJ [Undibacterium sp.]
MNKNYKSKNLFQIIFLITLTGCSSLSSITTITNTALDVVGVHKPEVPELPDVQKPSRTIQINLHAGDNLNVDENGRSLALVTKIYKLRQNAAFQQTSYETFLNPQKEREILGADLLEVKEIILIPGQRLHVDEKVTREAYFIGVVALFRSPASQRWRVTFPTEDT